MYTESSTFRPRNGIPAEAYWRVRKWCEMEGFSFSDVFNAVIVPLAYYLENHCMIFPAQGRAEVILNVGKMEILHVFNGKMYPLLKDTNTTKDVITLQQIQDRIDHWHS